MLVAEDAELAGASPEAQVVARVRPDAVLLQDIPDPLFAPVSDGPEAVDVAEGVPAVTEVGLVGFEDGVLGPLGAFFAAFAR